MDDGNIVLQNGRYVDGHLRGNDKDALRLMFCQSDNGSVVLNEVAYDLRCGDAIICFPGDDLVVRRGFTGRYLSIPMKRLDRLFLFSSQSWRSSASLRERHMISLDGENGRLWSAYFDLAELRLSHPALDDDRIGAYDLISFFIRDFLSIAGRNQGGQGNADRFAADALFTKFVRLLYAAPPRKLSVSYYADKLCVTPKYLSTICKQVAGETATSLINRRLVDEIWVLLRNRQKPIKAIAYELGFANQSFFGKFVKAHLGVTASQFRRDRGL